MDSGSFRQIIIPIHNTISLPPHILCDALRRPVIYRDAAELLTDNPRNIGNNFSEFFVKTGNMKIDILRGAGPSKNELERLLVSLIDVKTNRHGSLPSACVANNTRLYQVEPRRIPQLLHNTIRAIDQRRVPAAHPITTYMVFLMSKTHSTFIAQYLYFSRRRESLYDVRTEIHV